MLKIKRFKLFLNRREFSTRFLDNANIIWTKFGDPNNVLKNIFNAKLDPDSVFLNQPPHAGSLVKFQTQYGIAMGDLQNRLGKNAKITIVLPDSSLIEIPISQIDLTIPNFINMEIMHKLFHDDSFIIDDSKLAAIVYTLNITIHESLKMDKFIQDRNLLTSSYLSMALLKSHRTFEIPQMVKWNLKNNIQLKRMIDSSPILLNSLILSFHKQIIQDPIKFRIHRQLQSIYTPLNPMECITSKFFLNPINLMTKLNSIMLDENLKFKYKHILLNSNNFQLAKQYGIDSNFKNLIQFMKYTVLNPHIKLFEKLQLLLGEGNEFIINEKSIYEFLKDKNLYHDESPIDFINESGVIDLKILDELKIPIKLSEFPRPDIIKDLPKLDRIVESFNQENEKIDSYRKSYKLSNDLVFSVEKISLTSNKINLLIPIPKYLPKRGAKLTKAIGNVREKKYFIKLGFIHNLLHSNSIQNPQISIDSMKNFSKVDDTWFEHKKNPEFTNYDEKKLKCWTSLNKLFNFLLEWEKYRLLNGYLKINDNLIRDKKWMIENLKLLLDEQLSFYCFKNGININYKFNVKINSSSQDDRIFQKFKLFKWIGNSYDTFNFQLSSNQNDFTAFVSCLQYINPIFNKFGSKSRILNNKNGFTSLGLKSFACFSEANQHLEGYMNVCNLFNHLINKKNNEMLKPLKAYLDVCDFHFKLGGDTIFNWKRVLLETLRVCDNKSVKESEINIDEQLIPMIESQLQQDEYPHNNKQLRTLILNLKTQISNICDNFTKYVRSASVIGERGFQKCIGEQEGIKDIELLIKRTLEISKLKKDGTILARCIVIDPIPKSNGVFTCFCFDLDLTVDVKLTPQMAPETVKVGDRLLCTKIVHCDKLTGDILLQ